MPKSLQISMDDLGHVGLNSPIPPWDRPAEQGARPNISQCWKTLAQQLYISSRKGNGKIKINLEGKCIG